MLLAIDIGNTAIKFGLFQGETLTQKFSIPTNRDATSDEISRAVGDRLSESSVDSAIVCSVVPDVDAAIASFLREVNGVEPVFVTNSFNFGMKLDYEPLDSLGTDRLVAAFAAVEKYGAPVIVCSLGTATTIDVVNSNREFLGGIIAPGMDAMAAALHTKAARLPKIEVARPENLLGTSTSDSIRSGVYYGYVAMVEGFVRRMKSESGISNVVATGGNASRVSAELNGLMTVGPNLILNGLLSLAKR